MTKQQIMTIKLAIGYRIIFSKMKRDLCNRRGETSREEGFKQEIVDLESAMEAVKELKPA